MFRPPLAPALLALALALACPAHAEPPSPIRLAVASPELSGDSLDDRLACAALVIPDALTELLARRAGEHVVLDRTLVRALERADTPLVAEHLVRFSLTSSPTSFEVRLSSPQVLAARAISHADPLTLAHDLADALASTLSWPASPRPTLAPFPPAPACAHLLRALAAAAPAAAHEHLLAAHRLAPAAPRVLAALAESHVRMGHLDDGLALAERALAAAPTLPAAHFSRALAHDHAGRLAPALVDYQAALSHPPGLTAAHVNAGLLELRAGRLAAALDHLETADRHAGTWFVARLNLTLALIEAGDGRAAVAALAPLSTPQAFAPQRAIVLASAHMLAGDPTSALSLLAPLVDDPTLGPAARAQRARALALGPEHPRALSALDAALAEAASTPSLARLLPTLAVARARVLVALDRRVDAVAALTELAAADPSFDRPLVHRALVVLGGRGAGALEALVAASPDDHETWYDLGVLRQRQGDLVGAAAAYERAAALNPRAAWARYNRGLVALAEQDPAAALTWLEAARALDPNAADIAAAIEAARARHPR